MPHKNKSDQKRNKREYYIKNRNKILEARKIYQASHKEEKSEYDTAYYLNHKQNKLADSKNKLL